MSLDMDSEQPVLEDAGLSGAAEVDEGAGHEYSFLEADPEPCGNFRLDTTRSFGMCKCGHPKSAHGAKGENKAAELLTRLRDKNKGSVDSATGLVEPGDRPCNMFRVDTTATEFGVCKCGFKRLDHLDQQDNKAKQALDRLKSSNVDKYKDVIMKKGAGHPCDNYRVDTKADAFGVCLCGFKREDHIHKDENAAAKMLKDLKEKNKDKNMKNDLKASGEAVDDEEEHEKHDEDVTKLEKAEGAAGSENVTQHDDKKKKKRGKRCVIS